MINPPKPDPSGNVEFGKVKGRGSRIDSYPVGQTIQNLNEQILMKYNVEKEKEKAQGRSKAGAESAAQTMARNFQNSQLFRNGRTMG